MRLTALQHPCYASLRDAFLIEGWQNTSLMAFSDIWAHPAFGEVVIDLPEEDAYEAVACHFQDGTPPASALSALGFPDDPANA